MSIVDGQRGGRVWRRLAVVLVFALALSAVFPGGQVSPGGRFPVGWFVSLWHTATAWGAAPMPPTPKQETGTAAGKPHSVPLSATQARRGKGKAPGVGRGQLPAYHVPTRATKPVQSGPAPGVFDPRTSKRDASKSNATTSWFTNADGSVTRDVHAGVVNYRASDGTYQPIDTTLVANGNGFSERANGIAVSVTRAASDLSLGSVVVDSAHSVGYGLAGAAAVSAVVADSTATYPSVLANTDVRLTTLSQGFETEFVLRSKAAPRSFVLPLQLTGLTPRIAADGTLVFVDAAGVGEVSVPPGSMMDSKFDPHSGGGAVSRGVTYQLTTVDGQPAVAVVLDGAWLDDPARVYPVVVDPTTTVVPSASTFASDANQGNNSGSAVLKAGTPDPGGGTVNTARSFLQFASLGNIVNQRVTSVTFTINDAYAYHCSDPEPFTIGGVTSAWTPSGITQMSNSPGIGTAYLTINIQAQSSICANMGWNTGTYQTMSGPLNSAGVAAVQSWALGGTNFGLSVTASETNALAWKVFDSTNTTAGPFLSVTTTPDVAPVITGMYPPSNYSVSTLTPELMATATDQDNFPNPLTYTFQVYDATNGSTTPVDSSPTRSTPDWTVDPGKLSWGKTYYWDVVVSDGQLTAPLLANFFSTPVPQPLVTSGLSANEDGHGFSPSIANYTTSMTDAQVPTVGPALAVERSYNSRDPRVGGAFGAGWSSVLDAQARTTANTVIITYPNGSEIAFGLNADGSYSSPPGRFSVVAATSGGFTLTDKNDTTYTFTQSLPSGAYGITSITDANARTESFAYDGNGRIVTITSASGRKLNLTWSTPGGASAAHVSTVVTDPVTAGNPSSALTWTYTYSGDQLSTVCPPGAGTACHGYSYTNGSLYQTSALDATPSSYWPLSDAAGQSSPANAVLGAANGATATNVTFGSAGGLAGSAATAASFNGTSSYVGLPNNLEAGLTFQTVSLWFKTTASGQVLYGYESDPVTNATTTGYMTPALYVGSDGKLNGEFYNGTGNTMVSTTVVNDGNWHQALLTAAGSTQSMYLDGTKVDSRSGQIFVATNLAFYDTIGAGFIGLGWPDEPHSGQTGTASFFNGSISDFALYDRPLSQAEISQIYTAGRQPAQLLSQVTRPSGKVYAHINYNGATGLVSTVTDENGSPWTLASPRVSGSSQVYVSSVLGSRPEDLWRLNDASGTSAVNQIYGQLATYNNVTLGAQGHYADATAASFNGTSSYLQLPNNLVNPGLGAAMNQAVSLWFKTTTPNGVLFSFSSNPITSSSSPAYDPSLYVGADGKLVAGIYYDPLIYSSTTVTDGNWHQAILSTSGSSVSLYLDGTLQNTTSGNLYFSSMPYVYVGAGFIGTTYWADESQQGQSSSSPMYFTGSIADVAFFNAPLSTAAVADQYRAALSSNGLTPMETVTVTDPGNHPITYTYDLANGGRALSSTDAVGRTTRYGYDTGGFESTVTDANGMMSITGHDVRGNVVSSTVCQYQAGNGCSTTYFTYYPDDSSTALSPDPRNDLVLTVRDPRSSSPADNTYLTSYGYDSAGDQTTVTTPPVAGFSSGRVTTTAYTDGTSVAAVDSGFAPKGLPMSLTTPSGAVTSTKYLKNGDTASTTTADGAVTSFTYDGIGRVLSKTVTFNSKPDGTGTATTGVTSYTYTPLGQVATRTDPAVTDRVTGAIHTPVTTQVYDGDGDVLTSTVTDSTGGDAARPASYTYDGYDRVATETDAASHQTSYTYDAYGNTASRTTPAGDETDYTYNADSQLLTTTLKNYIGDPANPSTPTNLVGQSRAYDPGGRLASVTDAMGYETEYSYLDNGLIGEIDRYDPTRKLLDIVQYNFYDTAGNLSAQYTNDYDTYTTYSVDAANRTTAVNVNGVNRATTYTYTPDDAVATATTTGGGASVSTSNTYDPMGNLTSRSVSDSGHGSALGWWPLNDAGGTTAADATGNAHTATATGGVTLGGGAATFDGSTGYLQTTGPVVNTAQSFTVSAWANLPSLPTSGGGMVVAADGSVASAFTLSYSSYNKAWDFEMSTGDVSSPNFHAALASSGSTGWTHLVGVYDASTHTLQLYVNGALAGTSSGVMWAATGPLSIGRRLKNGSPNDLLQGSVANVQVYQQALSASQVSSLYTSGQGGAPLTTGQLTTTYTLNQAGQATAATDPNGNTTLYSYDEAGRLATTLAPQVNTEVNGGAPIATRPLTMVGYDTFGEQVETSDANGNVTTYGYDAVGGLHTTTLPNYTPPGSSTPITAVTTRTYDADGRLATTTDPLGHQSTYTYDQLNDVATMTAPDQGVTHNVYDPNRELLSSTDPTGAVTQATYDYLGRQLTQTNVVRQPTSVADTTTNTYVSSTDPWLTSTTTPNGVATSYTYDNIGELTSTTDGAGNKTSYTYDLLGRKVSTVYPDNSSTTLTYDQAGRATATALLDPTNTTLTTSSAGYDNAGNLTSQTDGRGNTTTFSHDPTGLVVGEVQPVTTTHSITTSFGYDPAGHRTRYTDGRGNSFIYTYNSWGLPESQIEPSTPIYTTAANSTFTTAYDANGRPVSLSSPGGVQVTSSYSAMGDLTGQSGAGADAPTANRTFGYDQNGRLTSASAGSGTDTFTYDDRGSLLTTAGPSGTSSFSYDHDGMLATRADAAGTTTYGYDSADRLSSVADPLNGITASYQYNPLNQVSKITYGSGGLVRSLGYDSAHRPQSDTLANSAGTTVASITYGWDNNSNLTSKATSGLAYARGQANTYTYDQANRLTSWSDGVATTGYGYDESGNRTQVNGNTLTYDPRDQLTSAYGATYTYTARGTLASVASSGGTFTDTADAYGQTINFALQSYTYDALGRTLTASYGTPNAFSYSGIGNTIASDGTATYTYDPAGGVFAAKTGGTPTIEWADQHTDVIANFNPTGPTLTGTVEYDPLGQVIAGGWMRGSLGYQSGWTDTNTSKVHMGARWYDPAAGQFTSRDTWTLDPEPNSASANPFAYVADNPLTGTDPSGHCWLGVCQLVHDVTSFGSTVVHDAGKMTVDLFTDPGNLGNDFHQAETDFSRGAQRFDRDFNDVLTHAISEGVDLYHKADNLYHRGTTLLRKAGNYITHSKLYTSIKDKATAIKNRVVKATKAAVTFVKSHAVEIAAFAASTVVFLGCEAAVSAPTLGVGALPGAVMCGALAGAVSGAIEQAGKCYQGAKGACSLGAFAQSIGTGVIGGAIGGGFGGTLGGKIASGVLGKAMSSFGGKLLGGALEGGVIGGLSGGTASAVSYGLTCDSHCSLSGLADSTGSGALTGAIGGAGGGALFGGFVKTSKGESAAEEPATSSRGGSCGNSFDPTTPVLMANGSTKPIKDVGVGDKVLATDPVSGTTLAEPVTLLHDNHDADLTDLNLRTTTGGKTRTASLHTTTQHPFWDTTIKRWTYAGDLHPGDHLRSSVAGAIITVAAVHSWTGQHEMLNLTVNQLHTYYVIAGDTPVLVHNTDPLHCELTFRADNRSPDEIYDKGFEPHGNDMDLLRHAEGNPDSGYVATSYSREAAEDFAPNVYTIRTQSGVDVNENLGPLSPYPHEAEVAVPGGVPSECITGCILPDGTWVPNPRSQVPRPPRP
jgi:RHS repeat-associated protein